MKGKAFSKAYISAFCMELHLTLQAGISMAEGVKLLSDGEEEQRVKDLLSAIADDLMTGNEFSSALEKSGAFPQYMTDMIRVAESTGKLESVLKGLYEYYDRQEQLSKSIKSAVVYPVILLAMMLFVVIIIITNVLPIFNDVFSQLGSTMPPLAMWILNIGIGIRNNWPVLLAVIAVIIIAVIIAVILNRRHGSGNTVLLSRRLGAKVATSQFALALSMTLQAGLDLDESMEMAQKLNKSTDLKGKLDRCRELIQGGTGLSDAVSQTEIFPGLYSRLLAVGAKTGAADTAMIEIARRLGDDAEDSIIRRMSSVEPTLVILMSVIVGIVLLAVMLPLVGIMSSLG
ncbi:MAG: type II secretion system F family protein [Oscillospiraceae bacterium]|nr:type II secretion system F family protein [Oscillospiraceae bacterium]